MKNAVYMTIAFTAVLLAGNGCSDGDSFSSSGSDSGQGGSMARFTISGDHLYTVDDHTLNIVSIADEARPVALDKIHVGSNIETIFTMEGLLLIGSRGDMFIYDISSPELPKRLSGTSHFKSCDPVVAYGMFAYVTLNNSAASWCGGARRRSPIVRHRRP